jgi:hypothetical protein
MTIVERVTNGSRMTMAAVMARTMIPCSKLPQVPAVATDWQQTAWCPDCEYYDHGACTNPARTEDSAPCPWDGKVLPLREAGVDPRNDQERKPFHATSCSEQDSPGPSAGLERAIKDRILQRTRGRVQGLKVEALGRGVVIRGRAPCYYVKQLALQGALDVLGKAGAMRIELNVEVADRPLPSDAESE